MSRSSIIALIIFVVLVAGVLTMRNSVAQRLQAAVLQWVRPIHTTTSMASSRVEAFNQGLKTLEQLETENAQLKVDNQQLRASNEYMNDLAEQNNTLRQALDFKQRSKFSLLAARIIARNTSSWWNLVQIDRGEQDGLDSDMPVITDVGLVGKTTTVAANTAYVMLIADEDCKVAAYVEPAPGEEVPAGAREQGIVSGERTSGPGQPNLLLNFLPKTAHIAAEQRVFSSGVAGGVFPRGLLLGIVRETQVRSLDSRAILTPAVDLGRLENVFIVRDTREPMPAPAAAATVSPAPHKGR